LQFDRLCSRVLDLDLVVWEEREFGRVGLVGEGVVTPGDRVRLEPATLVIVSWLRPGELRLHPLRRLVAREVVQAPAVVRSVLVLTNVEAARVGEDVRVPVVHLGPERLSAILDASGELRLGVPSVLGIRDLGELIPGDVAERSTADVSAPAGDVELTASATATIRQAKCANPHQMCDSGSRACVSRPATGSEKVCQSTGPSRQTEQRLLGRLSRGFSAD
jgi:hypothetical protein